MPGELVSVIIPTYNRADCIERAVDSALAQSHDALEVIVIDDGSTDNTGEVVSRRYGGEPRLQYIRQQNQGAAAARNRGLVAARGDYVALLDSDDVWKPWKLELQLRCLRAVPEAGMIWTDMEAIGPDGELVSRRYLRVMYRDNYRWFPEGSLFPNARALAEIGPEFGHFGPNVRLYWGSIFSAMVMGNLVHTSTVLLRRDRLERIRGFDEALKFSGEDYDFHLRTCREGAVAFVDVPSIEYQIGRSDQLTHHAYGIHMARNFLATLAPVLENDRDRIMLPPRMIAEVQAHAHGWIGAEYFGLGRGAEARRHLREGLRHCPWRAKLWLLYFLSPLPSTACRNLQGWLRAGKRRWRAAVPRRSPST